MENMEHNRDLLNLEKLRILLDKENIAPTDKNIDAVLENKESGPPLLNIGEFLFMTNPQKRAVLKCFFLVKINFK